MARNHWLLLWLMIFVHNILYIWQRHEWSICGCGVWTLGITKRCKTRITIIFTYLTVGIQVFFGRIKCKKHIYRRKNDKYNNGPAYGRKTNPRHYKINRPIVRRSYKSQITTHISTPHHPTRKNSPKNQLTT